MTVYSATPSSQIPPGIIVTGESSPSDMGESSPISASVAIIVALAAVFVSMAEEALQKATGSPFPSLELLLSLTRHHTRLTPSLSS